MSAFPRDARWRAVENSAVAEAGELSIAEYLLRTKKAMMSDANKAKPEK